MAGELQTGNIIEALSAMGIVKSPKGRLFVVDPTDSGFTLQNAIDGAVAGNGDIIAVLTGGHTVTETVAFNKSAITVVAIGRGVSPLVSGEYFAIVADASFTDGPVATITANCRIIGIGFASRDTGALFFSGAACLIGGAAPAGAFGVHMKNCRFPKWGLDNRIGLALAGGGAVTDILIEECTFEGVGTDFSAGIYMQGACQNIHIRRNYFRQCVAAVKYHTFSGGGPHTIMERNIVEDGLILDSQGVTAPSFIVDNYSELAAASSYDASVATLQAQGIQFAGNHYTE